jgi:hypothetical protein
LGTVRIPFILSHLPNQRALALPVPCSSFIQISPDYGIHSG